MNLNKIIYYYNILGQENDSWGYYGHNGKIFCCGKSGVLYGPLFTTGDTIGCCLNFMNNTVFYTKNGVNLGIYYQSILSYLF